MARPTERIEVVVTIAETLPRSVPPSAPAETIGRSCPLGPPSSTEASTSACSRGPPRASNSCSSTARTTPAPSRVVRIDPATNRTYHYWHAFVPRVAAGTDLRLPGRGAVGPRERAAVRSLQGPARPVRPGRGRPEDLRPRGREEGRRQRRDGDEERGRRSGRLRLGGGPPAGPALLTHHHLRDARPRIHAPPELRGRREDPGHLRRTDREDSVSPRTRHHGGRIAPGVRVRRPGLPAGTGQLLGIPAGLLLRSAPGLQLAERLARPGGRVPRHGEGPAPGGHRGHPRRGVQPHRRGGPHRADAQLPRDRQPDLLHPRRGTARGTPTTPAAGTRSTRTTRSSAA